MYVFAGLGNPGKKYENTPHNAGFLYLDDLREYLGWDSLYSVSDWKLEKSFESMFATCKNGSDTKILLVKPLTFMNESGRALNKICKKLEIDVENRFILVHDDLDIELGKYKIQREKGPKEHNGVLSVERRLGTRNFLRLRIGVENREENSRIPGERYVLKKMADLERIELKEVAHDATKSLRSIITV
jgi:PTH1 family peptidyl-tRNA hydrolase